MNAVSLIWSHTARASVLSVEGLVWENLVPLSKKPQASAYQRAGSMTREEVTSYRGQTHLDFLEEKQQRVLRGHREREPGRHGDKERKRGKGGC